MTSILCFYHSPCNDGSASAAALQYRLQHAGMLGDECELRFCPLTYTTQWDEPFPKHFLENEVQPKFDVQEIYLVDVSISEVKFNHLLEHLRAIHRLPKSPDRVVCIDHHKTALDKTEELERFCTETFIRMGSGLSGATLVWKYFNELFGENLPTPPLLRYVADQDIWEWKLEDSREINAALNTLDGDVHSMEDEFRWAMNAEREWYETRRAQGEAINKMVDAEVLKVARHTVEIDIEGTVLHLVNTRSFSSELGNYICTASHSAPNALALIYSLQEDWAVRCSVRSIEGARVNARRFAEMFGGGGHDHAAGCRFASFDEFRTALEELAERGWEG